MNSQVWHDLLGLESRDIVDKWFAKIHGRELNARRCKEIMAAARQAREFFRNSSDSDFSVKPLLTFYGVASLSRSLTLLLKREGGEETLKKGHGLETDSWSNILSGDVSLGLGKLGDLKVRTCAGLFSELVETTNNTITMHVRSSRVDWRIPYPIPATNVEISLKQLFSRLPDLASEYSAIEGNGNGISTVNEMTFSEQAGFMVRCGDVDEIRVAYSELGYTAEQHSGRMLTLRATNAIVQGQPPQFTHAYVDKMFGSIPNLYVTAPFSSGVRYSQLAVTYVLSYILGMLARYFPSHWISLIQGEKGDALWPIINRAHHLIEQSFPELVSEFIADRLNHNKESVPASG